MIHLNGLYRLFSNKENLIITICIGILLLTSILVVSSATQNNTNNVLLYTKKNIIWTSVSILFAIIFYNINYKKILEYYWFIYGIIILLLVSVLIFGTEKYGAKSWIVIGGFSFQPSEFTKIAFILFFAKYFSEKINKINEFKELFLALFIAIIPLILIWLQPDFGTLMIYGVIFFTMLFVSKLDIKYILATMPIIVGSGIVAWNFLFKEYQKKRILVFLNPNLDPLGSGYNVIQSKIAIGSGKILGKGLFLGTQNNFNFIPKSVKHSDFIFSIIGEEFGFLGSLAIIIIYFILITSIFKIILKCKNNEEILIITGIVIMFIIQTIENIGMTIGLMPVTGIPLPFLSYGGSALLTNMISIGIILNINTKNL